MYRALLFSVYVPSFLTAICLSSAFLTIPLFALELGADVGTTSLVFAMAGLGNVVVVVPAGYLTSRLGDRTVMLSGVALLCVAALFASQATSALHLSIGAFALGCAIALWSLARLTHLGTEIPLHMRGKAIATMAGVARVGALLGPVSAGFIASRFGYGAVFISISATALLALGLLAISIKANIKNQNENRPSLFRIIPHITQRHWRTFVTAGSSVFCLNILRACRGLLVPLWGVHIGLDAAAIGMVVGAAAAIDMVMFPIAGYVMDHWGRRYAAVSCQLTLAFGILLIPLSSTFATMTLFAMIAGFGNGLGSGINMTLGSDFAPHDERSEFLGVWRLVSDTGSIVGPLFAGAIAGSLALGGAFVGASAVGVLGAVIMVGFVKETLVKRPG